MLFLFYYLDVRLVLPTNSWDILRQNIDQTSHFTFNSVFHRTESISYLAPEIWNIVPEELKKITKQF